MEIKLHARNIDDKLRVALYAMTEFAMARLVPSKRLRNNVSINVHLKHHDEGGEAMMSKNTNPKRPREFEVIVDHHRAEIDNYNRTRTDTEWGHEILKTLAHELVHVKQYIMGELTYKKGALCFMREKVGWMTEDEYYCSPHEVEAYGKEKWLQLGYTAVWNKIESGEI